MSSRMDKYNTNNNYDDYEYNPSKTYGSRSRKNENLYQEMSHDDFTDVNLTSNAHGI